ncbi:phrA [Symbiodinium natans]|uniref:PhrA protein n=1 Tax=Symbiodinium natans TaxID=878477 RepID=A0A812M553_9DINO|nr:phrA [Symbiodinium natans]
MGRYGKELGALEKDPAGKYLDEARRQRKERLGWRAASSSAQESEHWPSADLSAGMSMQVVTRLLEGLAVGARVSFRGLGKEERALVHSVAHRVPGLSKTSRADPDTQGQRMVCVERVAPVAATEATAATAATAAAAAAATAAREDASTASATPASSDTAGPARRSRWRRAASTQQGTSDQKCSAGALIAGSGYPQREEPEAMPPAMPAAPGKGPVAAKGTRPQAQVKSLCIVWLRDDMRLEDNPALFHAAQGGFDAVLPLYILEPESSHPLRGAGRFWKHQSLRVFAHTLSRLGSRLVFRRGDAAEEIQKLLKELGLLGGRQGSRVQLAFKPPL